MIDIEWIDEKIKTFEEMRSEFCKLRDDAAKQIEDAERGIDQCDKSITALKNRRIDVLTKQQASAQETKPDSEAQALEALKRHVEAYNDTHETKLKLCEDDGCSCKTDSKCDTKCADKTCSTETESEISDEDYINITAKDMLDFLNSIFEF